jgi:hypothetical protein
MKRATIRDILYGDILTKNESSDIYFLTREEVEEYERYKKLKEQDKLIELPCRIGDHIFLVKCYGVEEANIRGITEADDISYFCFKIYIDPDCYETVALEEFNDTWFLTRAEAEAKIKEMRCKDE